MDGLDALMLGEARAVLQRCVPHRISSVDWQGSSLFRGVSSWTGQRVRAGEAPRNKRGRLRAC
jgi:hypothetical protein